MKVTKFMVHKNNIHWQVISGALLSTSFLVLGVGLLHPFTIDSANADSKNTAVSLRIGESIMVPEVSTDSINIELDPTAANGDFKTASVTVGVSTNRTAGYTLTASVEGSETALTNTDYDNYEIAALSTKTSADDFADLSKTASMNKWGYATDNNGNSDGQTEAGYYYAMPNVDNPTTLKITDGPAATSNTEVTFATKGKDLAAGKYENTVVFTAVGNIEPIPTMQDFTAEECSNLDEWSYDTETATLHEGDTIILYDKRDNNDYKVRKLADGNCWMVQNLRLVGPMTLTAKDSDLGDVGMKGRTFELPKSITTFPTSDNQAKIVNAADIPIGSVTGDKPTDPDLIRERGTYYTWAAAVADTSDIDASNNIATSICPKGWKLPIGGEAGIESKNQFYNLYVAYGSQKDMVDLAKDTIYGGTQDRGDYIYQANGLGYWWTSTAYSENRSYYLDENYHDLYNAASHNGTRRIGASVRCVFNNS